VRSENVGSGRRWAGSEANEKMINFSPTESGRWLLGKLKERAWRRTPFNENWVNFHLNGYSLIFNLSHFLRTFIARPLTFISRRFCFMRTQIICDSASPFIPTATFFSSFFFLIVQLNIILAPKFFAEIPLIVEVQDTYFSIFRF